VEIKLKQYEKIFTFLMLSIFFFSCKKNSLENKANNQSAAVSVAEAKVFLSKPSSIQTNSGDGHHFNYSTLLSEIDWKNASNIDNDKVLIGLAKGQPSENGTKIGFRKAVFFKNSLGKVDMLIFEFLPDVYHLWKYRGVKRDSYDGKVFIYDKDYRLKRGYLFKSGKITGDIKPYSQSNIPKIESTQKTNIVITTCSQSIQVYESTIGTYEVYVVDTCSSTYIADYGGSGGGTGDIGSYIGGGTGGGAGGQITPVLVSDNDIANAIPVLDNRPQIDPVKFKKCFEDGKTASSFKLTIYIAQPVAGSNDQWSLSSGSGNKFTTNNNITFNVGHAFVGFEKINIDGTSVSQYMGFY
jgi:hypothetical protein